MALDPTYYETLSDTIEKAVGILNNVNRTIDRATGSIVINGTSHFAPTEQQQINLANNVIIPLLTAAVVRLNQAKNQNPELP